MYLFIYFIIFLCLNQCIVKVTKPLPISPHVKRALRFSFLYFFGVYDIMNQLKYQNVRRNRFGTRTRTGPGGGA